MMKKESNLIQRVFVKSVLVAMASVTVLAFANFGHAEEDDGTPYVKFARKIEGGSGHVPLTPLAYEVWSATNIRNRLSAMELKARSSAVINSKESAQCSAMHEIYTRDRVIDIHYALGYFDESTGHSISHDGYDWGEAPSYDEGVWIGIREVLTGECPNSERRLCGFKEKTSAADRLRNGETVLTRNMEVQGREVEVRITLTYASASPFYDRNKSELKAKQERYTRNSEDNYFGSVGKADYLIYMGHSRTGGGPDFNPPRLTSVGKPDYFGYYQKVRPGINRLTQGIRKSGNPNMLVGLFSCSSADHFRKRLLAANKKQRAILTLGGEGVLDYFDTLTASVGYLEGLLRGSCGQSLDNFVLVTERDKAAFQQFGVK